MFFIVNQSAYHIPVLCDSAVSALGIQPDGIYVDATYGGGGHSAAIMDQLRAKGHLYAFDQDETALSSTPASPQLTCLRMNFRYLKAGLRPYGVHRLHGLLADLGLSSHQLDRDTRGFSTRRDGYLDMRMDRSSTHWTASDWLCKGSQADLQRILSTYGELRRAHAMARALCKARAQKPIQRVFELKEILMRFAPPHQTQRFWAQVFQALRIAVNDELTALKELLLQARDLLIAGGRLVVISYHSLEDRLVKRFLRTGYFEASLPSDVYGRRPRAPFVPCFTKPLCASKEECSRNPRARSAKLRAGVKQVVAL